MLHKEINYTSQWFLIHRMKWHTEWVWTFQSAMAPTGCGTKWMEKCWAQFPSNGTRKGTDQAHTKWWIELWTMWLSSHNWWSQTETTIKKSSNIISTCSWKLYRMRRKWRMIYKKAYNRVPNMLWIPYEHTASMGTWTHTTCETHPKLGGGLPETRRTTIHQVYSPYEYRIAYVKPKLEY